MTRGNWIDRSRPILRLATESFELRLFGRSLMTVLRPGGVLVLETRGRRSGRRHTVPVAYLPDEPDGFVIGGGAAGMTRIADWVLNLRSHPRAAVVIRRHRIEVIAIELHGEARERAHDRAREVWPSVDDYERRSGRPVPYFHLRSADHPK